MSLRRETSADPLAQALLSLTSDAMLVCDPTGVVVSASDAVRDRLGIDPATLIGQPLSAMLPGSAWPAVATRIGQSPLDPAPFPVEVQSPSDCRQLTPATCRLTEVRRDGVRTHLLATLVTVPESAPPSPASAHLMTAEEQFQMFFEEVPGATYIYPVALHAELGMVTYRSHQFRQLTGFPHDIWANDRDFIDLIVHPDDRDWVREHSRAAEESGDTYDATFRIVTKEGRTRWVHERARLATAADGQRQFWIGIVSDISQQKAAERRIVDAMARVEAINQELEQQSAAKSAFITAISHELRTPMTSIQGFSELIETEVDSLADAQYFAAKINREAERLRRLVHDILDLDRLTAGQMNLLPAIVRINELIADVIGQVAPVTEHQLTMELDPALPLILGDRDRLTQALTNLVANAVKYSPPGSVVEVCSYSRPRSIEITVADNGFGVPESARESIFDPYTRVLRSEQAGIVGSGLGLPITRKIAQLHGGQVWVEANQPVGSIFHLELPLTANLTTG